MLLIIILNYLITNSDNDRNPYKHNIYLNFYLIFIVINFDYFNLYVTQINLNFYCVFLF
jgi:hypothetical protein